MNKYKFVEHTPEGICSFKWFQDTYDEADFKGVHNLLPTVGLKPATIQTAGVPSGSKDQGDLNKEVRDTEVGWIPLDDRTEFLFDAIAKKVMEANKTWGFELQGFEEGLQYGVYNVGSHYDWHLDVGEGEFIRRKVTAIINLNDDYEGGEVDVQTNHGMFTLTRTPNDITLFPSFLMHRVRPVTKGTRLSLVAWIGGIPFR